MTRYVRRAAAAAAAVVVPLLMFGGAAQAGDPQGEDGAAGEPGTGTVTCRWMMPSEVGVFQCTAVPGEPGAGGAGAEY